MKFKQEQLKPSEFQIAPMIDIVFLLLIFFIMTWRFSNQEVDLKVSVPTSTDGKETQRPLGEIIINVRSNGDVILDGNEMSAEALSEKLKRISRVVDKQPVRLRGSADCSWQTIASIIDTCQKAGIKNISFATQKPDTGNQ